MIEIPTRRTLATLALSALAVCGCTTRSAQPALLPAATLPDEEAVAVDQSPAVEELYARAQRAEDDYREAVDSLVAGDEVIGEEQIVVVTREINRITEECARTRGCDLGPVLAVFGRLIGEQEITLKSQAARIGALEASLEDEADPWREPGTSPFVAAIPELGRTDRLLHGADLRELITLNAPVNAALDDWLTWMRPMLMDSYENYQYLRDEIAPVYEEAGLPEALLFAMIATESGGKVHSYSSAGAVGLLQFMRHTGRSYGLKQVDGFDGRLDPVAATRANVAYLNKRFSELNNSLEKALAAYNGGEGRMRTLNRRHKGASLWDNRIYYSLPRETRAYVPRILAAAWLFLHPDEYSLRFPTYDTAKTELVLQQEISIGELTICLGQEHNPAGWFRTLRNLNPQLAPGDRIEAGVSIRVPAVVVDPYREQCLDGEVVARARELHAANYPPEGEMIPYIVARGDTLGRIASRYGCVSLGELAAINNIRPPRYTIRIGQTMKIPRCK
jgi:membrane-bound lytic murein transglycosylase D